MVMLLLMLMLVLLILVTMLVIMVLVMMMIALAMMMMVMVLLMLRMVLVMVLVMLMMMLVRMVMLRMVLVVMVLLILTMVLVMLMMVLVMLMLMLFQSQRQSLLTQLAAVSNLSKAELEDAVDAAVTGEGAFAFVLCFIYADPVWNFPHGKLKSLSPEKASCNRAVLCTQAILLLRQTLVEWYRPLAGHFSPGVGSSVSARLQSGALFIICVGCLL